MNKTATTITVNWTALDSSVADGYVVNVTSDTDTVQTVQVEGSNNNTITLNGLRAGATYNITVRAYQQLLGPASSTISVTTHCQDQGSIALTSLDEYALFFIGIYLIHNRVCYSNDSYFWDANVNSDTDEKRLSCVLPSTNLTTGQWVRVAGPLDPVDCNSNSIMMILFSVLLSLHLMLLSVFILLKYYQQIKKDFTSVVYQLIVLLLLTLSLLIYSVRKYNGLID